MHAMNNTSYIASDNIDDVIKTLENDSIQIFNFFLDNQIKSKSR